MRRKITKLVTRTITTKAPQAQGSTIPFFQAFAKVLSSAGVGQAAIVTGGGVANLTAHLEEAGIKTTGTSNELAAVGYAAGTTRTLRTRGLAGGTLGVGAAQQVDAVDYLSKGHALPAVTLIGDNADGKTGPTHFQPVNAKDRYSRMTGGNVSKITADTPEKLRGQLAKLAGTLERTSINGEATVVSAPQNFMTQHIPIHPLDEIALAQPHGHTRPKNLTSDAESQLDELTNAVNKEGAKVLFVLGEGLAHSIRLEGEEVHSLAGQVMDRIVGNRIATSDWQDMLHGHKHELPPASHNYDPQLQEAVKNSNIVIFLGAGPNATLTGLQNGLQHYTRRTTKCFLIDSSTDRIEGWKHDPDLSKANMSYIHAPIKQALENLSGRDYYNTSTRTVIAERTASAVRQKIFEGPQEVLGAQKVRNIAKAITQQLEKAQQQGLKVALSVSSGDAASQAALRYRETPIPPGNLYYPNEGMLGTNLGAARAMADTESYDVVVAFIGDGEAGYTPLEIGAFSDCPCPIITIVFNNQGWGAVDKAQRPGIPDPIISHMRRYGKLPNTSFTTLAESFTDANIRTFSVKGDQTQNIAKAVQSALEHKGPSVIEIDTRMIEQQSVLGKS